MNSKEGKGIDSTHRLQEAAVVTVKSLIANILLVVVKILSGVFGRSSAMIADGIHSLSDSVSDIFLLLGLRLAYKPPDKTHRYGHGKFETLLTVIISLLILLAGIFIFWNNGTVIFQVLFQHKVLSRPGIMALIAAIFSLFIKEFLYRITRNVGRKHKSNALIANAWHHRTDALTSVAAFLGIGGAIILGERGLILDPLAALLVSAFIIAVGVKLLRESVMELLETSIGEAKERSIINIIKSVQGALNPHSLKTRKVGNKVVIDVHIEVNSYLNVIQAHNIADKIEKKLLSEFGADSIINVHIEPFEPIK